MIIRHSKNKKDITSILNHEDIVKHTGKTIDDPLIEGFNYFIGYEGGKPFALAAFNHFRDGFKYHPHVLNSHKRKYGNAFVSYCATMLKCPVYVEFPSNRKDLINLARKNGFDSLENNSALTIMKRGE